jgi:serine/threonine-protein kinase PpkA
VAENPMAIIYQHRRAPIPRLPETLATLQPLIDGLLAKSPEDRFGSATAVCAQLRRYLADWPEEVIA